MKSTSKSKPIVAISSVFFLLGFLFLNVSSQALLSIIVIHISFSMIVLNADLIRSNPESDKE
ncbi:hypothetical protein L4C54_01945 [Vibrio lamellibrachiae]|uniref:hypothetical protein n=1 Tax=Vibrio lamellibrachiae TaxID=2910253 RepID=UPI003D0B561A